MALVKAPNGDVYDLPDATASGLVGSTGSGWSYAKEKAAKAADSKPTKKAATKAADSK